MKLRKLTHIKFVLLFLFLVVIGMVGCTPIQLESLKNTPTSEPVQTSEEQAVSVESNVPLTDSVASVKPAENSVAAPQLPEDFFEIFGKGKGLLLFNIQETEYDVGRPLSAVFYYQNYSALEQHLRERNGPFGEAIRFEALLLSSDDDHGTLFSDSAFMLPGEVITGWLELPLLELGNVTPSMWTLYRAPLGGEVMGSVDQILIERLLKVEHHITTCPSTSDLSDLSNCATSNNVDIQSYDWTRSTGRLLLSKIVGEEKEYQLVIIGAFGLDLLSCRDTSLVKHSPQTDNFVLLSNCGSVANLSKRLVEIPTEPCCNGEQACRPPLHWVWYVLHVIGGCE